MSTIASFDLATLIRILEESETLDVYCVDAEGRRYEIVALLDENGSPVLKIQAVGA